MDASSADDAAAYWETLRPLAESLAINGIAIIVSLATLVVVLLATIRLYKKARVPGSGYLLAALIGSISGIPVFIAYLVLAGDQASRIAEDFFNLYEVSCVAVGAWGYWRISKAVVERSGGN